MAKNHAAAKDAEKDIGDTQKAEHRTEHQSHTDNHQGEHPKKKPAAPLTLVRGSEPAPGACFAQGCKSKSIQFNFCTEHYDHFKFGLIKKTGEPVSDYEKKFEHYLSYKAKQSVPKAA